MAGASLDVDKSNPLIINSKFSNNIYNLYRIIKNIEILENFCEIFEEFSKISIEYSNI